MSILRVSWPILIGSLSMLLVGLVDVIVVAILGIDELAAVGVALAIFMVASEILSAFTIGFQIAMARAIGGDRLAVARSMQRTFMKIALAMAVLFTIIILFSKPIVGHIAGSEVIGALAFSYLIFRLPSLVILVVSSALRVPFDASADTKPGMKAALMANFINAVTAPVLALGLLGMPVLGVAGAGLAGTCGGLGALAYLAWRTIQSRPLGVAKESDTELTDQNGDFLSLSKFEVVNAIGDYVGNLLFVALIATLGIAALAAHRVSYMFLMIVFVVVNAVATGVQILMSQALGNAQELQASGLFGEGAKLLILLGSAIALILLVCSQTIGAIFAGDQAVAKAISDCIMVVALTAPVVSANSIIVARLRANRASNTVMWINLACVWIVQLPLTWLICGPIGMNTAASAYLAIFVYFFARSSIGLAFVVGMTSREVTRL